MSATDRTVANHLHDHHGGVLAEPGEPALPSETLSGRRILGGSKACTRLGEPPVA